MEVIGHIPVFVWWLVAIAIVLNLILRSKRVKGVRGALYVRFVAWRRLDESAYQRLHNVMLRTPDGATQIDHIFISRFGVFVVETKHIRGWIFGRETDRCWTQDLHGENWQFQNPLRQNYKHVKAVERVLGADRRVIHSVIVFTANTTFKTTLPSNVTLLRNFADYVKSFNEEMLSQERVKYFTARLQRNALPKSHVLRRRHVKRLHERSNAHAYRRCPLCGNRLVIRTSRSGSRAGHQFWACSAYPKCRYTQDVS